MFWQKSWKDIEPYDEFRDEFMSAYWSIAAEIAKSDPHAALGIALADLMYFMRYVDKPTRNLHYQALQDVAERILGH